MTRALGCEYHFCILLRQSKTYLTSLEGFGTLTITTGFGFVEPLLIQRPWKRYTIEQEPSIS